MSILKGKNILLGISAGIAAYKTPLLVRLFVKAGAHVRVIMTPASKDFVTPLTLSTLSKNPVLSEFTSEEHDGDVWNNHVDLGLWADLFLIAPATANTLSKMATGNSDNFLIATYLSAKCPVYFAPAMDLDMHKHASTETSFKVLQSYGNIMIPSESGELASGLSGPGRLAEPETIVKFIENDILSQLPLKNKTVLITAGPTYEQIDPVRFIGNYSSGKMGFEIAKAASSLGAEVILVSGPSHETIDGYCIKRIDVSSSDEMYDKVHQFYSKCNIAILSAAVADFKPQNKASEKIKKRDAELEIRLEPTTDILASLGVIKTHQYLVGFALETNNELHNAKTKLKNKNLDLIVLNSLKDKGAGFGGTTNKVKFINSNNEIVDHTLKSKTEVAQDLLIYIVSKINA